MRRLATFTQASVAGIIGALSVSTGARKGGNVAAAEAPAGAAAARPGSTRFLDSRR